MKIKSTLLQAVLFIGCLLLSLNTTAQSIEQQVDAIIQSETKNLIQLKSKF